MVEVLRLGRGSLKTAMLPKISLPGYIFRAELLKLEFYPNLQVQVRPGNLHSQVPQRGCRDTRLWATLTVVAREEMCPPEITEQFPTGPGLPGKLE